MGRLSPASQQFMRAVLDRPREERKAAVQPRRSKKASGASPYLYPSLFGAMYGDTGFGTSIEEHLRVDQDLLARYMDYEHMDQYPELSAALDIFADDATQPDSVTGRTVHIEADDEAVKAELESVFYDRLMIDEHAWEIARSLCKYGNDFEEILVTDRGVIGLEFMAAPSVRRAESREEGLFGFVQSATGQFQLSPEELEKIVRGELDVPPDLQVFKDWQVAHMRLRSVYRSARFGFSVLEGGRWIWKRIVLLEDAMMVYKLSRAPSRYAFYVDVGKRPPAEALKYLNEVKKQLKKRKFVDPKTGQLDLRMNPLGFDEDFFIPVFDGTDAARIEVLSGPSFDDTSTSDYMLRKLYAAIKVPKMYLGFSEERSANSILSNVDVQFARSVLRVQRELRNGFRKIARVHLISGMSIDPATVYYDIVMTAPSGIYEIAQMEIRNARADLAAKMKEFVSNDWVLREIFGFSQEEIETEKAAKATEGGPEESIARDLRKEAALSERQSSRDQAALKKNVAELLRNDGNLRTKLQETNALIRELRTWGSGGHGPNRLNGRNGAAASTLLSPVARS